MLEYRVDIMNNTSLVSCFFPPGFSSLPSQDAQDLAFALAQRWIKTNWLAYTTHDAMFEKVRSVFILLRGLAARVERR